MLVLSHWKPFSFSLTSIRALPATPRNFHRVFSLFIHLFNMHFLRFCCVPFPTLVPGEAKWNSDKTPGLTKGKVMFYFGRGKQGTCECMQSYSLEELGNENREYSGLGEHSPTVSAAASCLGQVSGICATLQPLCFSFPGIRRERACHKPECILHVKPAAFTLFSTPRITSNFAKLCKFFFFKNKRI